MVFVEPCNMGCRYLQISTTPQTPPHDSITSLQVAVPSPSRFSRVSQTQTSRCMEPSKPEATVGSFFQVLQLLKSINGLLGKATWWVNFWASILSDMASYMSSWGSHFKTLRVGFSWTCWGQPHFTSGTTCGGESFSLLLKDLILEVGMSWVDVFVFFVVIWWGLFP